MANIYYGFPSRKLTVIGVTGTDGKTTTVSLIYHILKEAGLNVSMISSIGAKINGKDYDIGFHVTTPSSFSLQGFLKRAGKGLRSPSQLSESSNASVPAVSSGDLGIRSPLATLAKTSLRGKTPRPLEENNDKNYLVLEITSHALDQYRVWGIDFEVGVLTNVTHEHLDYHKTYENYVRTKAMLLKKAKIAVVNRDDESYRQISNLKSQISKVVTYGMTGDAEINPNNFSFKTKLIGEFNKYNCLAAIGACRALGVYDGTIRKAIESFEAPAGREEIIYQNSFSVMVDFAHTPNAFWKVLPEAKKLAKNRLIHVFGAAGKRDFTKRPEMGKASSSFADIIVLTAEDPRGEPIEKIFTEIKQGIKGFKLEDYKKYKLNGQVRKIIFEIPRREDAINFAVSIASEGDFVITTGKSHEKSMNYGKGEEVWDEFEVVKKAIKARR